MQAIGAAPADADGAQGFPRSSGDGSKVCGDRKRRGEGQRLDSRRRVDVASGVVMWDQTKQKGTMFVDNLPKPAADKDYQLWVLDGAGNPIDCGVIALAANGMTTVEFSSKNKVDRASNFAITLEPKGGLPKPTLPSGLVIIGG